MKYKINADLKARLEEIKIINTIEATELAEKIDAIMRRVRTQPNRKEQYVQG